MKRWAAITALAVMAVPIAFFLGGFLPMAVTHWRGTCVRGGSCIRPIIHDVPLNVTTLAIVIVVGVFWWAGWYRLTRAGLARSSVPFGASQFLAAEFFFLFALPLFLSVSNLSLL